VADQTAVITDGAAGIGRATSLAKALENRNPAFPMIRCEPAK